MFETEAYCLEAGDVVEFITFDCERVYLPIERIVDDVVKIEVVGIDEWGEELYLSFDSDTMVKVHG